MIRGNPLAFQKALRKAREIAIRITEVGVECSTTSTYAALAGTIMVQLKRNTTRAHRRTVRCARWDKRAGLSSVSSVVVLGVLVVSEEPKEEPIYLFDVSLCRCLFAGLDASEKRENREDRVLIGWE